MNFIGNIGYVAVAILGGYLAVNGKLQLVIFKVLYNITSNLHSL